MVSGNPAKAGLSTGKVSVLGAHFSVLPRLRVHEELLRAAREGRRGYVCVANVHTTMTGVLDANYRRVTNAASFSVPDGVPIVWAMRSLGHKAQDRVHGPSLMRDLIDKGRQHQIRHYLYGGSPETLRQLQEFLERTYPGVEIVGAESPPFQPFDEITEEDFERAAQKINATRPHFVWVGLGAPKQEKWMNAQADRIHGIMFGIGAAFDILPGRIPEAPKWMQASGLEWFYRLTREPRRLWSRYLFFNPAFLILWAGQRVLKACGKNFDVKPAG